ncbi:hypothetical protein [Actinoplanes sp. NPDC023714]|uniref:hypothetical protein n=1 Tax=Actinoplanes sp. NPDC023714 TaxID=3154322 RepID=UPI0034006979
MSSPADNPTPEAPEKPAPLLHDEPLEPTTPNPDPDPDQNEPEPEAIDSGPHPEREPEPIEISAGPFQLAESTDDERAHDAANRRKLRTVLLAALLVIILAGAVTLAVIGFRVNSQRHTTLSTPATIGTLTLDDSEDAAATAEYLRSAISAEITMDKAVGAVYTTPDDKSVLFFGGTRLLWSPDDELETAFTLLGDEEGTVTNIHDVEPGDFGGTMQCGITKSDGTDLQVCGWADHGSLAVAMFLNRTPEEAATLMQTIRTATQTRN